MSLDTVCVGLTPEDQAVFDVVQHEASLSKTLNPTQFTECPLTVVEEKNLATLQRHAEQLQRDTEQPQKGKTTHRHNIFLSVWVSCVICMQDDWGDFYMSL